MWLYFKILALTLAIPLILSFDRKLQFWRQWKYLFPSICLVGAFYLIADIYLTRAGVWGFEPAYHINFMLAGLPLEEWLFFIAVPYASIFLHDSLVLYFPWKKFSSRTTQYLTWFLVIFFSVVTLLNSDKTYTLYIGTTLVISLVLAKLMTPGLLNRFYLTFLVILIPFIFVDAALTGSFIEGRLVWYNDTENLGIRIFTIPIEDFGYAFSMIVLNLTLREKIKMIFSKKETE